MALLRETAGPKVCAALCIKALRALGSGMGQRRIRNQKGELFPMNEGAVQNAVSIPRGGDRRQDRVTAANWTGPERRLGIRRVADLPQGLHLLDLSHPPSYGFRNFICAWFFVDALGRRILVDPGPAHSVPLLVERIRAVANGVDLILLTHVHPTHSGGVAKICEIFGGVKVVVHPEGRRLLLETPEREDGAAPLDPYFLWHRDTLEEVEILETPGRTPDHLSFIASVQGQRIFFAGEAAGMFIPLGSTPTLPYMRPSTPPGFDAEAAKASLAKMERAFHGDGLLCYGHWGAARRPQFLLALARGQLDEWISAVTKMKGQSAEAIADHLLQNDPLLGGYGRLPEELRTKERLSVETGVRGLAKYLAVPIV